MAVADIDGDGDLDIIASAFYDNAVYWYRNDGAQNFTKVTVTTTAAGAMSVAVADIDGDGHLDIVSASFDDSTIAWYKNSGGASPTFTKNVISTTANGARFVAVADLDGDGNIDVVSASYNDNKIAWYQNNGSCCAYLHAPHDHDDSHGGHVGVHRRRQP